MTDPAINLTADKPRYIFCRPSVFRVAEKDGADLARCDVCGELCWRDRDEPDPLPVDAVAWCTECAMKVGREMK